jgi:poly-gamma-glutamate synthesis protein (capsule biosynthesis protein)
MSKSIYYQLSVFVLFPLFFSACGYFNVSLNTEQSESPFSVSQEDQAPLMVNITPEEPQNNEITFPDPLPEEVSSVLNEYIADEKMTPSGEVSLLYEGIGNTAVDWYYVAVTAFDGLEDNITESALQALWQGKPDDDSPWSGLFVQETDIPLFAMKWGEMNTSHVQVISRDDALILAWKDPKAVFLLPFEQLDPRWKVLKFDNGSIFSRPLDGDAYPLNFTYSFSNEDVEINKSILLPITNFDQNKMTTVLMTGVTALARGTGAKMDTEGVTFPASSIIDVLLDADITHISNEVSFAVDCPLADADTYSVMFCSRPEYFDLFTYADIDVVELSGNHLKDWSQAAFDYSLDLYKEAGIPYYTGGVNQQDARKPYLLEMNGNKLAFVGCNPAGPENVWATDDLSGVANCDDDWLMEVVQTLVSEGYMPIVTMQHYETYAMEPNIYQKTDFLNLSSKGAVIVSGSQAHLPQGMSFVGDHFIHYGLGNLFFDQMDRPVVGTRREFLDRHVFYDGKYIQTELYTAMLEDYARPRIMTEEERLTFLTDIFTASQWMGDEE